MRILKIESLPSASKKWVDRDSIMLHACFQILKDCVEKEAVDTHCNYEKHKEQVDEVRYLYNWWIKRMNKITSDKKSEEDDLNIIRLMKIRNFLWT